MGLVNVWAIATR